MNIKRFIVITLGIAAVAAAGATKAQAGNNWTTISSTGLSSYSCFNVTYGISGTYFSSVTTQGNAGGAVGSYTSVTRTTYTSACTTADNTSNTAGSVITAVNTLRAATAQTVGLIANRISFVRNQASVRSPYSVSIDESGNAHLGFAGGSKDRGIGIWVQGSFTHLDNDSSATIYDGNVITGMVGIDKELKGGKFLIGLSLGHEKIDLDTAFNSGNLKSNGFIVAPYASLTLKKGFSVDASLGYAQVEYDQDRLDPAISEKFTANGVKANRYFGSLNVNASKKIKKANLGATLSVLYSSESKDSFTETGTSGDTVAVSSQSSHIGQARFGVNAGISLGKFYPYAKITGVYDFSKTKVTVADSQVSPSQDDFGADFTVGVNLKAKNFTGTFEGYTSQFRKNWSEYGGAVRLRIDF